MTLPAEASREPVSEPGWLRVLPPRARGLLGTRLRRNSLFSLLGFLFPTLLMLAATPVLLHRMGAGDYGLWAISMAAFGVLAGLDLGVGMALSKYVAEHASRGDARALSGTVTAALSAYVSIALLLTPALFFSAPTVARLFRNGDVDPARVVSVIQLVALGIMPLLLRGCGLAIAMGIQRFEIPMVASVAQNALTLAAALVIVYAGGSVRAVVLSSLIVLWLTACSSLAIGVVQLWRLGARPLFSSVHARETLSYVGYTSITSVGMTAFGSADRVVVGVVAGLRAVTYYTVSIAIAARLLSVADVLTRPLMPAASARVALGDPPSVRADLIRATRLMCTIFVPAALVGVLLSGPFLRLWAGTSFSAHALPSFRVLIVIYALLAISAPGFHTANGAGYPAVCAAACLVGGVATVVLIALLGPRYGTFGAAVANAAYLANLAVPAYVASRLHGWSRPVPA
jgi:O-antigen/teichoic acid export membrane protein